MATRKANTVPNPRRLEARLLEDIAKVREMMLTVHYFAEANWLLAAVEFPGLCGSPAAQEGLHSAARIAREFGFPSVSFWINSELIGRAAAAEAEAGPGADALPCPTPENA